MLDGEVTQESEVTQEQPQEGAPSEAAPDSQSQAPSITELEALEKFKLDGQEMTLKELRSMIMRQADYTQKTQSLSEERKAFEQERGFLDTLAEDLERVKQNPDLVAEFKRVYPEKFHRFLGHSSAANTPKTEGAPAGNPEWEKYKATIDKLLSESEATKAEREEAKVNANLSAIDAAFAKLQPKYALAKESDVILAAQKLLDEKGKANQPKAISDQEWEKLFKTAHDQDEARYKAHYSAKVGKQKQLNQEGKDVASGGGTPGGAPKVPRRIEEAAELHRQALMG